MDDIADVIKAYMDARYSYLTEMMNNEEQEASSEYRIEYDVSALKEEYAYLESKKEVLK